jgi:hypothetical protein
MYLRHISDGADEITEALCPDLYDGVAILLILICDAFHDAAKLFHTVLPLI